MITALLAAVAVQFYPIRDKAQLTSLDGEWQIELSNGKSGTIKVPGNWETQGYKAPQYGNQIDEMTGVYTRSFEYKSEWEGKRVVIRLEGVLFGYDLYINDKEIDKDVTSAFNEHQFEITPELKKGMNTIKVVVRTRVPGWLWDTNDCWCLAGIQRSINIFTVPDDDWIGDIVVKTKASGEVNVDVYNGTAWKIERGATVKLFDGERLVGEGLNFTVKDAKLWSPESPYLYTLVVEYNGMKVTEKIGIREITWDKKAIYVNGKREFFRGVCWNEIMPKLGRAITREARREQMLKMKEAGINYIRTAHYPFGVDFYDLADEMGFYVLDEVPCGSRGSGLLKDPDCVDLVIDRCARTIRRDKNRACVFMWSFGNENAVRDNTYEALKYMKAKDPTRPLVLPQTWAAMRPWVDNPENKLVDVFSGHYFDGGRLDFCATLNKPFIQTEFAHSCGDGFCQFEDRWPRTIKPDNFIGGSVWMWSDQAVETDGSFPWGFNEDGTPNTNGKIEKDKRRAVPKAVQGVWTNDGKFWDSDGDRGTDGICYADGTPKEAYMILKRYYTAYPELPEIKGEVPEAPSCEVKPWEGMMNPSNLLLRVGRFQSLVLETQTINKGRDFLNWKEPYILHPVVLKQNKNGSWKIRWYKYDDPKSKQYVEGEVEFDDGEIEYTLTPSKDCKGIFLELGLTFDLGDEVNRLDWGGLGPYRSYPGKHMHNDYGAWARGKGDMYFGGNRQETRWAIVSDGKRGVKITADDDPFNVEVEEIDGRVYLSKNDIVLTIGGKSYRPGANFEFKPVSGEFELEAVEGLNLKPIEIYRPFKSTYAK